MPRNSASFIARNALIVFLVVSLALAGGGLLIFHLIGRKMKLDIAQNLSNVSSEISKSINQWRQDKIADAVILGQSPVLAKSIHRWLYGYGDSLSALHVRTRLAAMLNYSSYESIILVDTLGRVRFSAGGRAPRELDDYTVRLADSSLKIKKPVFSDFYRCRVEAKVHLDILSPIIHGGRPVGVVILRIDPQRYLYSRIQSWPTPSQSGEVLLVRRQGDSVIFLNDLRFHPQAAMNFKISISDTLIPAVKAVLGYEGLVEGPDYRGVPVLADVRRIPDSPWFMVAKMDRGEIFGPVRKLTLAVFSLTAMFIILTGLLIAAWYQRSQKHLYRRLHEAEQERKALVSHYEKVIKYANDIIILADENLRIVDVNQRALEAYGYTYQEMMGMEVGRLRPKELKAKLPQVIEKLESQDNLRYETEHQRKNGEVFPIEVSARFLEIEGKRYFQAIIRDITERKRAQQRLESYNRQLEVLNQCAMELLEVTQLEEVAKILLRCFKDLIGSPAAAFIEYLPERGLLKLRYILADYPLLMKMERILNRQILGLEIPIDEARKKQIMEETLGRFGSLREMSFDLFPSIISTAVGVLLGAQEYIAVAFTLEGELYGTAAAVQTRDVPEVDSNILKIFARLGAIFLRRVQLEKNLRQAHEELQTSYEEIEANYQELQEKNQALVQAEEELRRINAELMASEQELKAAEEELRQMVDELTHSRVQIIKERNFSQSILQNVPAYFVAIDKEGRILDMNPAMLKVLGYSLEEVRGLAYLENFVPAEDHEELSGIFEGITVRNERTKNVNRIRCRDGSVRWVEWHGAPVKSPSGELEFFFGIGIDITEQRKAEEKLRLSEENYRRLAETTNDVIILHDMEGRIIYVNRTGLEMSGYKLHQVVGRSLAEFLPTEETREMRERLLKRLQGDLSFFRYESEYKDAKGNIRIMDVCSTPIIVNNKIESVMIVARDITERKKSEEEIKKRYEELKRWQAVTIDREDRVRELKQEVNALLKELGRPERYRSL